MFSLPSDHEIKDRFERLGYVAPIRLISEDDAAACRAELEAFERAHPDKVGLIDMKANLLFRWIDRLTRNETLMRAMEPLIGREIPLPPALAAMLAQPSHAQPLADDAAALGDLLRTS